MLLSSETGWGKLLKELIYLGFLEQLLAHSAY